jgi:hypothetical protein
VHAVEQVGRAHSTSRPSSWRPGRGRNARRPRADAPRRARATNSSTACARLLRAALQACGDARMHQRVRARHEAVVDEVVLLDASAGSGARDRRRGSRRRDGAASGPARAPGRGSVGLHEPRRAIALGRSPGANSVRATA